MFNKRDIIFIIEAHQKQARKPSKAFRKWDRETPYHVHPIWCATLLLTETGLSSDFRREGAQALLYHDVLEDTKAKLPKWLSKSVKSYILDMTFPGGIEEEMDSVWKKEPRVRLLKLYDKVNNLLDGPWMSKERSAIYKKYTKKLRTDVEKNFGELNIVRIARAIT